MLLRMYFLQVWFNLADEALEESIYDSYAMRKFMKLDYFKEGVPGATTLLKFQHLLERNELQKKLFDTLNLFRQLFFSSSFNIDKILPMEKYMSNILFCQRSVMPNNRIGQR
jgi:hypothetical protein